MGEEEGSSYVQLMLAASLVIAAFLVILTCTWKLVRLLAMYKMESQIEVGTYSRTSLEIKGTLHLFFKIIMGRTLSVPTCTLEVGNVDDIIVEVKNFTSRSI